MRVLWLGSSPALGADLVGAPTAVGLGWIGALEAGLADCRGLELSVAFPWDVPEPRRIRTAGRNDYVPFPSYPRGSWLRRRWFDLSCRLEPMAEVDHLERVVEMARPDLIHVWGTEHPYGLVAERGEIPVLFELQGLLGPYTEHYCDGLSKLDLLRYGSPRRLLTGRSLLHRYYRYRRGAERERRMLAGARYVSGRTAWDRRESRTLAPHARYFHCDRLLRPPFYEARWRPRPDPTGGLRAISTLRGNAYKGIETVARCAGILAKRLTGGLRWTILGVRPGEEIHRIVERKLGSSFERLGVRLLARRQADGVAEELLRHDVYVHPSHIDNSPNALSEAMLVGMPVVATEVGGIPSLVAPGREGLLVPAGDPDGLAEALMRIVRDPEGAAELAGGGRRRAMKRHDRGTVVETQMRIYRQVLEDRAEAID